MYTPIDDDWFSIQIENCTRPHLPEVMWLIVVYCVVKSSDEAGCSTKKSQQRN